MQRTTLIKTGALLASVTLLAAACSSGSSGSGSSSKAVTIWTSVDQPVLDGLKAALAPVAKSQGITVTWSKVDNINQIIVTKVEANAAPDIAMIPQPGVIANLVQRHAVEPLNNVLDMSSLQTSMIAGTLDSGTVNGSLYGLLVSMNVKGLVWYPKKAWDAAHYTVPTTLDQLNTLTDQMRTSGQTPWCLGIESGTATGWPATDWFENLIMRYGGASAYNDWVAHKTNFNSPLVKQAAAEFQKIAFTQGNVLGGQHSIASNNFGTAGNPMFSPKPGCMMYMQGSFITGFFPKDVQAALDTDVGVFYLPAAAGSTETPVEGGGDLAAMFNNNASTKTIMKDLSQTSIGLIAGKTSSFLSPHKDFPLNTYPLATTAAVATIASKATAFLFDGSDAMPAQVGAGSFWKDMTNWISGSMTLDQALSDIDSSWPSSS
jgi:alpha-glucoside transport system substrate-binding protein